MTPLRTLFALTAAALVVSGCTASGEELYAFDSQNMAMGGSNLQDVQDTFEVPNGEARLNYAIGGSGSATVTIKDAAGTTVHTRSIATGGASDSARLQGESGTWSITIDFTNWQGGFALSITEP